MVELLIHLPEDLLQRLRGEAVSRKISLEEVVVAALRRGIGGPPDAIAPEEEALERFVRESGLFAPPNQKLGPGLEQLAKEVSAEERERLAEALSRGKSLSVIIMEDRG